MKKVIVFELIATDDAGTAVAAVADYNPEVLAYIESQINLYETACAARNQEIDNLDGEFDSTKYQEIENKYQDILIEFEDSSTIKLPVNCFGFYYCKVSVEELRTVKLPS